MLSFERMQMPRAVQWSENGFAVRIIDQRQLPASFQELELRTVEDVVQAIRSLSVRGAPAIGICAAMGVVAALRNQQPSSPSAFDAQLDSISSAIRSARPTAVNLAWAVDRVVRRAHSTVGSMDEKLAAMHEEATLVLEEDRAMCDRIGAFGATLLKDGARVLTHCNAGALATGGVGTALAPVYCALESGQRVSVIASETRPLLQGSRLTAWELMRSGVPVSVIADNMAASLMRKGGIDICLVGADRIAANGDTANKIGTYGLAVLARHHGIPFYVAAPRSTIDADTSEGADITIEERDPAEITSPFGIETAPRGVKAHNPAFDVTPAELITAIITDEGIVRAPYRFHAPGR